MIVWSVIGGDSKMVAMVGTDYQKAIDFIEKNIIPSSIEILRGCGLGVGENSIVKGRFSVPDETGLQNEIECEGWFYGTTKNRPLVILQRWELEDD